MTQHATSRFPAILIGGPPNAGKSVLSHSLKQALSRQGIRYYLLRAAPDGEGDWYLESLTEVAENERHKGKHTSAWREFMRRDIAYRPLPFLVDVGGKPTLADEAIFDQCTHAILLVKDETSRQDWQTIIERHNLIPLAILTSELDGQPALTAERPMIEGRITGLIRGQTSSGPVFEALLRRVQALFTYAPAELLNIHFSQAPVELVVDIPAMHRQLFPIRAEARWEPADLPAVFEYLPPDEPLALYGIGPAWLYAAAAGHVAPHPFYQFDARLGWISPPQILADSASEVPIVIAASNTVHYLHVDVSLPTHYLDYEPTMRLPLLPVPNDRGVVLDGKLPNWLYTGLVLYYQNAPWVAIYYPHLDRAVIIVTRAADFKIGETIKLVDLTLPHPNIET